MKTRSNDCAIPVLRPRLLSVAVAACFAAPVAFALPAGPQVMVGSAAFSQQTGALTVTNTPGTIINWQGFSIGASEAARFIQQGPASSVLNRVVGAEASAILGVLQSNGRVWLVNPNGILFGPSAQIDVQGLVASTLAISNSSFLAGRMNFEAGALGSNSAGGIQNQGSIRTREGGSVYLVAPDIENSGIIHAPNGEVMLAAGRSVSLVEAGHPDVQMVVSAPTDQATNLGQILVESGRASLFGAMLAQRGIVSASSVGTDAAGNIVFRAGKDVTLDTGSRTVADGATGGTVTVQAKEGTTLVSGEVSAKGSEGKGGTVQLLGERVGLIDSASVDASGRAGGGTVLVGGDYQGKNASIQNATATYVGANTQVKADATDAGDGGKVIVWSNDATRVYAAISAKGGANSGDGGFVETSGKAFLDFDAKVNTAAPNGRAGTLLLDPYDVTITDAVSGGADDSGLPVFVAGATTTISAGAIEFHGATQDISITASNNITLNELTSGGLGHTDLTLTGPGNSITLTAGNNLSFVNPATGIATNGGDINLTATAGSLTNIGKLTTNNVASAGNINLAAGNQIDLRNELSAIGVTLSAGAGGITQDASAPIRADSLEAVAAGPVTLDLANNEVNTLAGSSVGGFRFRNACCGDLTIGTGGGTSGVIDSGGGNIVGGTSGVTNSGGGNIAIDGAEGITVSQPINNAGAGRVTLTTTGTITGTGLITGLEGIDLDARYGIGSIATPLQTRTSELSARNSSSGDIAITNNSTAPGSLQLLIAQNAGEAGHVKIENNGAMTLADGGEMGATAPGNVTLIANGLLTIDNSVSAGGDIVLKGTGFTNNVGPSSLWADGRWLIYAPNPGSVTKNGLIPTLYQYNTAYPGTVAPTGNGFIYASPFHVDANFTGTLSSTFGSSPTAMPGYALRLADLDGDDSTTAAAITGSATYSNWPITPSTAAGSYALQYVSGLLPGSLPYSLTPGTSQTYTVSQAVLQAIAASLTGTSSKTYDGTTDATLTPGNFLLSGFVSTDSATVTKTTGTYASKNVGSGIPVSTSLAPADFSPVGVTNLSNYTLPTSASGNIGDITPASLGLSGLTANNKVYDATTAATVSGTLNGLIAGDAVILAASSASFDNKNVGTAKPVSVSGLSITGADAGNYSFSPPSGATLTADITPANLTVSGLTAQNKVYDATTAATITGAPAFSGVLGSDLVTLGGTLSGSFADKNVGVAKPVSVAGFTLAGTDAGNYTLVPPAGFSANITPAPVALSGVSAASKVYDATTVASVSGALSGVIGGDEVSVAGTGAFADKNVGTAKPVTVSGLNLTGADAGNYLLSGATTTTTADITVRPLSTWIGGASGNWSVASNWDALPDLSNVQAVSVPAGVSVTYDAAAGSTNLGSLTAWGLNLAGGSLNVSNSLSVNSSFGQSGGALALGSGAVASITQTSGNLSAPALNLASLSLNAPAGAITQSGAIVAASLNTQSQTGTTLNNSGNRIASFGAANSGSGDILLTNASPLTITGIGNSGGSILVDNTGAVTTTGLVSAPAGVVSILAHSPLIIGAAGVSAGGNVVLTAGNTAGSGDDLTLSGTLGSGGSVALTAGDNVVQNANVTTGGGAVNAVSQNGNISMALGTMTSTGGGGIHYSASSGNVALTGLNAGSGAIDVNAGLDITSVSGFTGANLIGGQAVIVAGGNANLSAQVGLLDVKVQGLYSITDVLTGHVITNGPTKAAPAVNQVTGTILAATQSATTQLSTADSSQKSADDKAKEDEAKKKQQTTLTTTTGAGTDVNPKNYCN